MRNICLLILFTIACLTSRAQTPSANFTAVQTAGCAPVVISFQDQSTGSPTSWQWNFGNGNTSTLQNPSTTYFTPGTYAVTLTATNAAGSNTLTRTGFITVYAKPSVNFRAADSAGCAPFSVQFTDLSTPAAGTANTAWLWDFGNGTNSAAQNPSTTYTTPGNYTVSLKVTSDKGCFATFSKTAYVQITGGLTLDFATTGPARCRAPFPVSFTNNSTGPGTLTYFWTFGDGGTSTAATPFHVYATPGAYNVSLAVTSSNGCTDTLRKLSLVNIQNITTAFTAPDSACIRTPVAFANTSSPAPQSSTWDFGDATSSTAANPLKAFNTPGIYTVRLVNTYAYCNDSASKSIKILPRPVPGFTAANTTQCKPPLTVNFNNTSTGGVSWQWNFGDGNTSTQQNPQHTYTSYGDFDVTLIVTNASGCTDTLRQLAFVRIQKPVIAFPTLPQLGCVPFTTTFSANVTTLDNITSYLWNFGDGNTSTAATPTHTYPTQGTYNVSLTVTTSTGCTEQFSLNGGVTTGRVPTVDFTASPNPVCTFGAVQFTALVSEGDTWQWNFGDGGTSTIKNPTHAYTDTGSYSVSFTATNSGCPVTVTKPAFIQSKPPIAGFTFQNDCNNRRRFQFTDTSKGATSWQWDFGDGNTSTLQNPSHVFPAFGTYLVSLTVMNDTCSNTKVMTLKIFDESPTFTADKTVACKTAFITFTPQGSNLSNLVSYQWDIPGIGTVISQVPQIQFPQSGNFSVSLITADIYGCKDTTTKTNFIRINGPTAAFTIANNQGCTGLTATFNDASQTDGVNALALWEWRYDDGASQVFSVPTNPQHAYNGSGSFSPQLIVTDAAGCKDSSTILFGVRTNKPQVTFTASDTLICLGSAVNFSNSLAATNILSFWDFGDGTGSTQALPTHTYANTGAYTVKLKVIDAYGCPDSLIRNLHVQVKKTVAAFTVSDSLGGCTPFEVRFTNTSAFYESSLWQLGNGTSTVASPSQVYNTPGTYNIKLTVTGRGGCVDTAVKTIRIYDAAATTFSYTPFNGCKPLQLSGTINSPANLDFVWDFGDGAIDTTTALNITHNYNVFGNYVPKLLLFDSGNCLIPLIGVDTVRILGANAKFGWSSRQFCDTGTVAFIDSTTFNDPIASYTWDFGDGTQGFASSPTHSYGAPGLYSVSLAVQTQQGCRDTFRVNQLVKVVESPSIIINGDSIICQNDAVQYTGVFNRPDTSAVRWNWTFPNGGGSAQQVPLPQTFTAAGSFVTQAIATNSSGCADTATRTLVVNPLPTVTIASPQITPLATPVLLPATYTNNIVSYTWTPTNGLDCADCPQPFASPKFNTRYTVTVVDDNGCRATGQVQVIVLCQGSLVFVPNTFSPNGDGSNDVFYVRGKGLNRVKSLRIFNRWGETVFDKQNFGVNDPAVGWDGTHKGQKLAPDVYVYQVEVFCDNSEIIRFDGSLTLIR